MDKCSWCKEERTEEMSCHQHDKDGKVTEMICLSCLVKTYPNLAGHMSEELFNKAKEI
jgi:hypothetical protein